VCCLALGRAKCQSSEMPLVITGTERSLTYGPREITIDDGTRIAHSTQGGDLESVWAGDLGDLYVEVVHLGDGPTGGELVLVVPAQNLVAIGDLFDPAPGSVSPSWPVVIDLVLGLLTADSAVHTTHGEVDRERLETYHQELLTILHAGGRHG